MLEGERTRVARYLALEREKQELRRERDHLLLDLASSLGAAELSQRLGLTAPATARLIEGAHERLNGPAERECPTPEISARRLRHGESRWAGADAHYEALGRSGE